MTTWRYGTDNGPPCDDCGGMIYTYEPVERPWARAQCRDCHRTLAFRVSEWPPTLSMFKLGHALARQRIRHAGKAR
jgi:hypothetical protein